LVGIGDRPGVFRDAQTRMFGSDLAADVESVDIGQGEIEEYKIGSCFVRSLQRHQ
jgi:hypothetical protein